MLIRTGNKVYRVGRYLERIGFLTHFMKVQFESYLDCSIVEKKEAILESVLQLAGQRKSYKGKGSGLKVEDVFHFVSIENTNPNAILADIIKCRELAGGIRDLLSLELWEYINRFYHSMIGYSKETLQKEGIHSFAQKIESDIYLIKGYTHDSMIRNDSWMLLSLGIHMERAIMVNRMLLHQAKSNAGNEKGAQDNPQESAPFALLLKSVGAYGMYKQAYNRNANREDTLHFLIVNEDYPKSITFNISCVNKILTKLCCFSPKAQRSLESDSYSIIKKCIHFNNQDNPENILHFLDNSSNCLEKLSEQIEKIFINTPSSADIEHSL